MTARLRRLALGPALLLTAACGAADERAVDEGASPTAVDRAVAVARDIQMAPGAADSILAAHGLTRAGFDALMYDIAADSALARAYAAAIR